MEVASFILTEELYGAEPLDVIVRRRFRGPGDKQQHRDKRRIIDLLAALARRLHGSGMNHQDFYLNHFFLDDQEVLYLLDLQRIQRRAQVPRRYLVKDLGQLNYSALCVGGFSRTDRLRFLLAYLEKVRLDAAGRRLVREITAKTTRIARHDVKLLARRRRRGELPPAGYDQGCGQDP
jgi:heptose I phosphotransferase